MPALLGEAFGDDRLVLGGVALFLSDHDEPEPDFIVVSTGLRHTPKAAEVALIVEVSEATLRLEQTVKAALYASHGIPEYLILAVANRRAEIRRKPRGEEWGETIVLSEDGAFSPLGANGPLRVTDLLAPREVT